MKRVVVFVCIILFASSLAWGKGVFSGTSRVSTGPHNLSGFAAGSPTPGPNPGKYNTDEDSICVFCHTPHGGSLDAPLWNRANPTSTWQHYNSATMSTFLKGLSTARAPGPESLLCLSCHDGSISVNHVINAPNDNPVIQSESLQLDTEIQGIFGNPGSRIGGSPGLPTYLGTGLLTDDHPISFSYNSVVNSNQYLVGDKAGQLHPTQDAIDNGVEFFGATSRLECTSCHDPHVDYSASGNDRYAPFLIMTNSGSALCLACHVK